MSLDASQFINNRYNKKALTLRRVHNILIAVINSYQTIQKKRIIFDCSKTNIGSIKPENYLRNRFVDDFLIDKLDDIKDGTTNYIVAKDSEEEYKSTKDEKSH